MKTWLPGIFAILTLGHASIVSAEVSKCGEVFTDKPCVNGVPAPPVARSEPPAADAAGSVASEPSLPEVAAGETSATVSAAVSSQSLSSAPAANPAQTQAQIKPLVMERPEPWMDWKREEVSDTRWIFKGKLKGNGKTRISLVISKASYTGNVARDYVEASRIFELPSWGGETEFNFPVDVPPPMRTWNWRWFLKAEYVGKWEGYRDFRGCCGAKDVQARCKKDGSVECSPTKTSESCRCF